MVGHFRFGAGLCGNAVVVDRHRVVQGGFWANVVILAAALAMDVYALVLGIVERADHSVIARIADIVLAAVLLGAGSWRIQFRWNRLHAQRQPKRSSL